MRKNITEWLALSAALLIFSSAFADDLKVNIGYATALHGEIAAVLGKTDIGKKYGLDIKTVFFQYGPPQIEALVSKSIDVSFTSLVPTGTFLSKQPGVVVVIAGLGNSYHGLVVPADSPIHSIKDFKGKSIAVAFGTDAYVDLLSDLKKAGLDPAKDVKLLNVPPNEQPAALEQKLADGVLLRQPQLFKFIKKGARQIKRWPHQFWVIARSDYLKENPQAREALVQAIREAVLFVVQNPQKSAAWFAEDLRLDPALVEKIAAENPLYDGVKTLKDVSVEVSPELKAFADKRAQELLDFGQVQSLPQYIY
jgi:sulfonate transport system substrate-binding protein